MVFVQGVARWTLTSSWSWWWGAWRTTAKGSRRRNWQSCFACLTSESHGRTLLLVRAGEIIRREWFTFFFFFDNLKNVKRYRTWTKEATTRWCFHLKINADQRSKLLCGSCKVRSPRVQLCVLTKCQGALQSTACSLFYNPLWQCWIFQTPTPCKPDTSSRESKKKTCHTFFFSLLTATALKYLNESIWSVTFHTPPPPLCHLWGLTAGLLMYFAPLIVQERRWLHRPGWAENDAGVHRGGNHGGRHWGTDERRGQEQRRQNWLRWWGVWGGLGDLLKHSIYNSFLIPQKYNLLRLLLDWGIFIFVFLHIFQSSWSSWKAWSNPEQEKIQSGFFLLYFSLWLHNHPWCLKTRMPLIETLERPCKIPMNRPTVAFCIFPTISCIVVNTVSNYFWSPRILNLCKCNQIDLYFLYKPT